MRRLFISAVFIVTIFILLYSTAFAQLLPLVKCGTGTTANCTTCNFFELIFRIYDYAFKFLMLPVVVVAFLIGGLLLLTSAGSETKLARGKSILWNTVIGVLIAFTAWVIVNTIIVTLAGGNKWFNFPDCTGQKSPVGIHKSVKTLI